MKTKLMNFGVIMLILLLQLHLVTGIAALIQRKSGPIIPDALATDLSALVKMFIAERQAPVIQPAVIQPQPRVIVEESNTVWDYEIQEEEPEDVIINTILFAPYDDDGMPQHTSPAKEVAPRNMPDGCPIPLDIWLAIDALEETPEVKSMIAGAGWVESRWDVNETHYDNDGGNSHGWLQLHGKWRKDDVDWMKSQPGGWRDAGNNLEAFMRTLDQHEGYYPKSRDSWKYKLAHYNGGTRPNLKYANHCLDKSKELISFFPPTPTI